MKVNSLRPARRAEDAGLLAGGAVWKPKEGDNRIRLVSECLEHPGTFNGKPTFKWLCFILDRADGLVKPYFMPNNVFEQIEALQLNPDYAFDEVPMPFDITSKPATLTACRYLIRVWPRIEFANAEAQE